MNKRNSGDLTTSSKLSKLDNFILEDATDVTKEMSGTKVYGEGELEGSPFLSRQPSHDYAPLLVRFNIL